MSDMRWSGKLEVGDRWAIWQGAIGTGQMHRHFAAQAAFSATDLTVFDQAGKVTDLPPSG